MDTRPIGMIDSGVGGLTVLKEVIKNCPNEDIIYIGDTKRFPYGSKSKESIIELTKNLIDFLISKNVKAVVIACGTATSQALEEMQKLYDIPVIGIISSTARYIKEKNYKKIGVIATKGTIRSKGWENKIKSNMPDAIIENKACPLLAPMAEEGWTDNEIAKLTIKEYLKGFDDIDCLVLGCTHYPLFKNIIKKELGENVDIINTGETLSNRLNEIIKNNGIENSKTYEGQNTIYLTDVEESFIGVAEKLLEDENIKNKIQYVNI